MTAQTMVQRMASQAQAILLTRPKAQNLAFLAELRAAGVLAEVICAPVTKILAIEAPVDLSHYAGAIFTSRNGVTFAPAGGAIAWCVGDKTAGDAKEKGWSARSVSGDVDALFKRICADMAQMPGAAPLVHFCGQQTRGDLVGRLSEARVSAQKVVVYRQESDPLTPQAKQAISGSNPPVLPVFSVRSAQRLIAQLPAAHRFDFVAISPSVAAAIPQDRQNTLCIAREPNAQSMVKAIQATLKGEKGSE